MSDEKLYTATITLSDGEKLVLIVTPEQLGDMIRDIMKLISFHSGN